MSDQAFYDQLMSRVDGVAIIESVVKLRRSGSNFMGLCPFHNEKTPSFSVSADGMLYNCFSCGEKGNIVTFMIKTRGLSRKEALETLATSAGMTLPKGMSTAQPKHAKLYKAVEELHLWYQSQLGSDAAEYIQRNLVQRGMDMQTCKDWGIGWSPRVGSRGLHPNFPTNQLQVLMELGLVRRSKDQETQYDLLEGRIIFPIRDFRGRAVGFAGRITGTAKGPKYINSSESAIFHKSQLLFGGHRVRVNRDSPDIILVEGYTDVIALARVGINNAVAAMGTSLTSPQVERVFRLGSRLLLCLDGDTAGQAAGWRVLKIIAPLLQPGREVRILILPEGEDPDTIVQDGGGKKMRALLESAHSLSQFLHASIAREQTPERVAEAVEACMGVVRVVAYPALRQLLRDSVAESASLDPATLKISLTSTEQQHPATPFRGSSPSNMGAGPVQDWGNEDHWFEDTQADGYIGATDADRPVDASGEAGGKSHSVLRTSDLDRICEELLRVALLLPEAFQKKGMSARLQESEEPGPSSVVQLWKSLRDHTGQPAVAVETFLMEQRLKGDERWGADVSIHTGPAGIGLQEERVLEDIDYWLYKLEFALARATGVDEIDFAIDRFASMTLEAIPVREYQELTKELQRRRMKKTGNTEDSEAFYKALRATFQQSRQVRVRR